ncbi:MAG: alpha-amylase [Cytophagaceae bacterium]|nr:alpha-amylase [Cytophagaceae bacterium]
MDKYLSSVNNLDLLPKPGKHYWKNCHREWREEFIYFLLVDRFHDDRDRNPIIKKERSSGFGTPKQLSDFYGGTIKGITKHLDYIKGLGCTALWLSPVFENDENSYHGYAIRNYLNIEPKFGTKEDMIELVEKAHNKDMRVFLDVVLNHSGDTWFYPGGYRYYYHEGIQFPFGGWRSPDYPLPVELRNPDYYSRKGEIRNWDAIPETRDGDFFGLKNFLNDESEKGKELQEILIKIHSYWIKELDIDGYRLDAVKHMGERAVARFCSRIREYAYSLGKKNFFLFGELVAGDEACNNYIGPNTSTQIDDKTLYYGLNSVLDFPLYHVLPDVIKGVASAENLIKRYDVLRKNSLNRGEYGEFLVTFLDNHDQVGGSYKKRFGYQAKDEQIIAGVGFLLCALGTPCIYYGTEQGFEGHGEGDEYVREAFFNLNNPTENILNKSCAIYKSISLIAALREKCPALKFGRMYIREISESTAPFQLPHCEQCVLAFSRILADEEIVIIYNSSMITSKQIKVKLDSRIQKHKKKMAYLYGGEGELPVEKITEDYKEIYYIQIQLNPMQFVIFS